MTIKAMKQALEALELHGQQYPHMVKGYCLDAITSLRQAIAEAEKQVTYAGNGSAGREADVRPTGFFFQMPEAEKQEPVAKAMTAERALYFMERFKHEEKLLGPNEQAALDFVISMLETPPQRQPLTDEHAIFAAQHMFLEWNRAQDERLVKVAYEYSVFQVAIELYKTAAHGIKGAGE